MGKAFRFSAAHQMAWDLGPEESQPLSMFHALMDRNTISCFARYGKRPACAVWTTLPQLTKTLNNVSTASDHIGEDVMRTIERFVILIYDRTATDINKARRKLFSKKSHVQLIPSTNAALSQHVRRAIYQCGHVWDQTLVLAPTLPSPIDWDCLKTSDVFEPL